MAGAAIHEAKDNVLRLLHEMGIRCGAGRSCEEAAQRQPAESCGGARQDVTSRKQTLAVLTRGVAPREIRKAREGAGRIHWKVE